MEVRSPGKVRLALRWVRRKVAASRHSPVPAGTGKRILILSASTGGGHMSAAFALEAEAAAQGHTAIVVDTLDHTARGFRVWFRGGYETLVRSGPSIWGLLYRSSDKKNLTYGFQTLLDFVFVVPIWRLLRSFQPDWVLCTHSLPQPQLALQRGTSSEFRMAVVVTDLYPHRMWLRGSPDHFFVPGDWTKQILEERYPPSKGAISVTGIPIEPRFAELEDKAAMKRRLGLDPDRDVVLVTSGGIGGGPMLDLLEALGDQAPDAQIVVVCGKNHKAKEEIEAQAGKFLSNLHLSVRGLCSRNDMADLVRSAEVMVSKPGGLTTFEALAAGVAFVIYQPFLIPGQEEGNADFLIENDVGVRATTPLEAGDEVGRLLASPQRRAEIREKARGLAKPHATREIIRILAEL